MKWISDILKQFNKDQRIAVLVICMLFGSITCLVTTLLKSDSANCSELVDLNKKYVQDFVVISDMIRKQRMEKVLIESHFEDSASSLPKASPEDTSSDPILDSILKITESSISLNN